MRVAAIGLDLYGPLKRRNGLRILGGLESLDALVQPTLKIHRVLGY
jgi:hypothetical protein